MENHVEVEQDLVGSKIEIQRLALDSSFEQLDGLCLLRLVNLASSVVQCKSAGGVLLLTFEDVNFCHAELGPNAKSGFFVICGMPPESWDKDTVPRLLDYLKRSLLRWQLCYHIWQVCSWAQGNSIVGFSCWRPTRWVEPPSLPASMASACSNYKQLCYYLNRPVSRNWRLKTSSGALLQSEPGSAMLVEGHAIAARAGGNHHHGAAHPLRDGLPAIPGNTTRRQISGD